MQGRGFILRAVEEGDWKEAIPCHHIRASEKGESLAVATFDYGTDYMLLIACQRCRDVLLPVDAIQHGPVLVDIGNTIDHILPVVERLKERLVTLRAGKVGRRHSQAIGRIFTMVQNANFYANTINLEED